tara:strand:+ start:3891 stop:4148 length:258 start_codon:yes stop_codon:yes gene_type:complete
MSYTFKGKDIIAVSMLPDNNMYEAYYKKDKGSGLQKLRFSAWDFTDGILNSLKKSEFTIKYPTWGFYRLCNQRHHNILGRKLYND